jgi:hypothetical protein
MMRKLRREGVAMSQKQDQPVVSAANDGVIINHAICDAILTHQLLSFSVGGERHVVEPHAYGVTPNGRHALLGWRVTESKTKPSVPEGWELVHLDEMRDVRVLTGIFDGHRPDYERGDKRLPRIHSQL